MSAGHQAEETVFEQGEEMARGGAT